MLSNRSNSCLANDDSYARYFSVFLFLDVSALKPSQKIVASWNNQALNFHFGSEKIVECSIKLKAAIF